MSRSIERRETSEPAEVGEVIPLWRERARRKVPPDLAAELDKAPDLEWGSRLFRFYEVADGLPPEARAYLGLIDRYYLTVEAWGLIDGMPAGRHYKLRIYDDVWTEKNVTTPEQITKTIQARELSDNLGVRGGREWNIGTRYSYGDGYGRMLDSGLLKPRIYPATADGTLTGEPVMLTEAEWELKKRWQPTQVGPSLVQPAT